MHWHDLEKRKVTELREMAKEKTDLDAVTGLPKEKLVEALAHALGIEKPHKVAVGGGKSEIKKQIRALKAKRDSAESHHDADELRVTRHEIHRLKRKLRRMARLAE